MAETLNETRYDVVCIESPSTPEPKVWHSYKTLERARKQIAYFATRKRVVGGEAFYGPEWKFAIYETTIRRRPLQEREP